MGRSFKYYSHLNTTLIYISVKEEKYTSEAFEGEKVIK
jgi:hypothetical protein